MKQKYLLAIMVCTVLTTVQAKKSKSYFKQSQFDVDFDITHAIILPHAVAVVDYYLDASPQFIAKKQLVMG